MAKYKSEFLNTLDARGFTKAITHPEALDAYCATGTPIGYIGFDATADSLHVGSLMSIMMLRHLQRCGGRPIALMGGGTTKIGDPTDKEKSRPLLTNEAIDANIASIKHAFDPFLDFTPGKAIMANNADWLDKLGYIAVLREVGIHFTINTMVKQDTVARRLEAETPYTFLEFNYLIMQSYDFLELFRRHGCRLQLGGSDQWGNILGGVDLVHKTEGEACFGLTSHLITTASGGKMGKSVDGAVWLNADRRSPYEYWQFWRNTEDADVGRFLKLFTELPMDEIARLDALKGSEINIAKIALANAATTMLHGAAAAEDAARAAASVFGDGGTASALPTVAISEAELAAGYPVASAFAATGLTESNSEARRLIKQGAAKVNDAVVTDEKAALTPADLIDGAIKLSAGKKRHALVKTL